MLYALLGGRGLLTANYLLLLVDFLFLICCGWTNPCFLFEPCCLRELAKPSLQHLRDTNAAFEISLYQFVIFNPLSYCFKEMIGFEKRPLLQVFQCLTRWYNKPGDITIDFSWIENYKLIYSCSYENNTLKISHC